MNNVVKGGFYTITTLILVWLNNVNAAINPGLVTDVDADIRTWGSAEVVAQIWLANILGFLYIGAVLIAIWWGFNILTAAWDEEKVKKGKTILIQAMMGLVIIFLAGSIIEWLLFAILHEWVA